MPIDLTPEFEAKLVLIRAQLAKWQANYAIRAQDPVIVIVPADAAARDTAAKLGYVTSSTQIVFPIASLADCDKLLQQLGDIEGALKK
jgi:hypothetical protein